MFRSVLAGAALLGLAAALAAPSFAGSRALGVQQTLEDKADQAEKALQEGAEKLMRMLRGLLSAIPQYEMPEMTEDGDIIIRRKRPEEQSPAAPDDEEKDDNSSST